MDDCVGYSSLNNCWNNTIRQDRHIKRRDYEKLKNIHK